MNKPHWLKVAIFGIGMVLTGVTPVFAANGSGTNAASPTSTTISSSGNTYTFTYTAAEAMDSGSITLTISSGWSTPQGTAGVAGYTTVATTGSVGRVLDAADTVSGWGRASRGSTACSGGLSLDTTTQHEGTGAVKCINSNDKNNGVWYKNISAQNWSGYQTIGFWVKVNSGINNGDLKFVYDNSSNVASPIESLSLGKSIVANTWTYVSFNFGAASSTRSSVISFGLRIANLSNLKNATVWVDNFLIGGTSGIIPSFSGNTITINALTLSAGQTITITYGAGGGTSGVTTPSTAGTYTFTTQSRTSDTGTLTNIASSPTISVTNPTPTLTSISPTSTAAGASQFTLTATGTNFVASSTVNWNGTPLTTSYVSATQLTAIVPAANVSSTATASVTVTNPTPGGGTTSAQTFTVNPITTTINVSSTAISSVYGNTVTFTATVTPSAGGAPSGTVTFKDGGVTIGTGTLNGGSPDVATYATSSLSVSGSPHSITAVYSGSGNWSGSTSSAISQVITTKTLTVTGVTAADKQYDGTTTATVNTGSAALSGVVSGDTDVSLVTSGAIGVFSDALPGTNKVVTISGLTLTGTTAGNYTLTQPTTTASITYAVPTLTSISPTSTAAGASQFTLTATGTNFVASSTVNWNGTPLTTSYVSATQLTAIVPAANVSSTATASVTVTNPTPGGGTTSAQTFTVNQSATQIVIVDPDAGVVGTPLTITVQAKDDSGQIATTFNGGVTVVASGTSMTGGGLVTLTNGVGTITISTTVPQTATVSLSDTQSTGLNVSSSKTATFSAGAVSAFALSHPGSASTGARVAYTVSRKDQYDNGVSNGTSTVYLYTTSTSTSAGFFNAETNGSQITTVTIAPGATSTQVWYYNSAAGSNTITASDNASAPDGTAGIADATDTVTFTPGATRFVLANVPTSAIAGDTTTFNVQAVDSFGAIDTTFNQGVTVLKSGSLGGSPTGGGLITIINGVGTSTIRDTTAETVTLTLQDTQLAGLNVSSTASITINAGAVAKFTLNHPGNMNTGTRLNYTLSVTDQFDNPTSGNGVVVYLSTNSTSTGAAFYDAASGGNIIASSTVSGSATSTHIWYYDTAPGSKTITASDNASAPDGTAGIADATDTFSVAPGAVRFVFAAAPAATTIGSSVTVTVRAVDSFGTLDTSNNQTVTITTTGSATGGGLVTLTAGVGSVSISNSVAETVTLGLADTEGTGLGVSDSVQATFTSLSSSGTSGGSGSSSPDNSSSGGGSSGGGGSGSNPPGWVPPTLEVTFSGWAYPKASIALIRKDQGLTAPTVTKAIIPAQDGSFILKLPDVLRLSGQTYLLTFLDVDGRISHTKVYNVAEFNEKHGLTLEPAFTADNILVSPTLGFTKSSVVSVGTPIQITGYATPKSSVTIMVDGQPVHTITVNDPSGKYRDVLTTTQLPTGRHSITAFSSFKGLQSDTSDQQSFTISPLLQAQLDLNGEGVVDVRDLSIFLSFLKNLGASVSNFSTVDPNAVRAIDFSNNGVVDVGDLSILLHAMNTKRP